FISAALGVVVAFAGFTYFGNNSSDTASVGNTAGTTQVSNTKVNTSSSMSGAYKKVNGAVVSVINLQKQQEQSSDGDISSIFGDLFGDSGSSDSTQGQADENGSSDSNSNSNSDSSSSSSNSDLQEYSEGSGVIYAKQNGK